MIRVLQTLALALLVVGLGRGSALAAKPSVVILGLEVIDRGAGIDQETTKVAKDFTTQLRARANTAGTLIAHAEKELVDEKLIRNCGNADATCMAPIGTELGATFLIYGSVEKLGSGFKISLHMLNVATKQVAKNIPVDLRDASPTGLADAAKTAYAGLMGGDTSTLNITIQNDGVDGGSVMINKDNKQLSGGHLTVKDLTPDRYTIAVDVTGFQHYEQNITLGQGEKRDVVVQLVAIPGKVDVKPKCAEDSLDCTNTVSHTSNRAGYKIVGYTALILAAAAGGFAIYEYYGPIQKYQTDTVPPGNPMMLKPANGVSFNDPDCSAAKGKLTGPTGSDFDSACSANTNRKIAGVVSGVAAGVAIAALILAYRGSDDEPEKHAQMGHRRSSKPLIAVTPIIAPGGGGATVRIDF